MIDSRTRRIWAYAAIALLGGSTIAVTPILFFRHVSNGVADPTRIVATTIAGGLAMLWAFGFAIRGFRSMDEFMRQRSQVAWYWGGFLGLAVSFPIYSFVAGGGLQWILSPAGVAAPVTYSGQVVSTAFAAGYGLLMVMEMIGFGVAWSWWRATKQ